MARMIPPEFDAHTVSSAEKRVFNLLRYDPDTEDWVVLHSLGLAACGNRPYGEIDFVILVPTGAVICLEVKGGRVSCHDGIWQTVDRTGKASELKRSPFMQSRDSMFALRNAVLRKLGADHPAAKCIMGHAVIFPDVPIPPLSPECEPWEAIGRDDLAAPISRSILRVIGALRKKLPHMLAPDAAAKAIGEIRQFLRPDFERVVMRSTAIAQSEDAIVSLTEDQYQVLDIISDNARCLVEGAAGTGKTVLALEYARRAASRGLRTLLLCYNRLLGEWFVAQAGPPEQSRLTGSSYFRFLRELILASSCRAEFLRDERAAESARLFAEVFPFYGQLATEEAELQFDLLVIDEAQDLVRLENLDVLCALLKGGLAGGHWCMFGDFTRQAIYGGMPRQERLGLLEARCQHFSRAKLVTNCRNTRRIGEETALLSGFSSPPYRLGQVDGLPVDYRYWRTAEQQLENLTALVRGLLKDGLRPEDLVILSPHSFAASIASSLTVSGHGLGTPAIAELREAAEAPCRQATLGFATIQAFKGMESPAVILCDIERVETDEPQTLLYVGMSRARSYLGLLVHDGVKASIAQALLKKLEKEWRT